MPKQEPKVYDKIGPYHLERYDHVIKFVCAFCIKNKASTLVATHDTKGYVCNACYGQHLKEEGYS